MELSDECMSVWVHECICVAYQPFALVISELYN